MSSRVLVGYDEVDSVVEKIRGKAQAYWDGWVLVIHQPNPAAYTNKRGRFFNGKWGFERRLRPRPDGCWAVPKKFL